MSVIHICASCRTGKSEESFRPKRHHCRDCENSARSDRRSKEEVRAYNRSVAGIARNLRNDHGYSRQDAFTLAARLHDDLESCELCGITNYVVKMIHDRNRPIQQGNRRNNTRLQPDHINGRESTLENTRLLCPTCNLFRRRSYHRDPEVWRNSLNWYSWMFQPRMTWWLHREAPGLGGRRFRNTTMQRKYESITGRTLPMTGPLPAVEEATRVA